MKLERKPLRGAVIATLLTLLGGFLYFYFTLPALNIHNLDAYLFVAVLIIVWCSLYGLFSHTIRRDDTSEKTPTDYLDVDEDGNVVGKARPQKPAIFSMKIPMFILGAMLVVVVVGTVIGMPIFRAKSYSQLLNVETSDFTTDIAEINYRQIPMLDSDAAQVLADRKLGQLSELVSQFEVANITSQINYQDQPVRVTYLNYGDFFKWLNNVSEGIPAYIIIDMVSQEVTVQQMEEGIRYSPSEYFFRDISRYLRFCYPTKMFSEVHFEINDEGEPYWIATEVTKTIGLFGGEDVKGAVLVNAVTGEHTYYDVEEVPTWVDRVYPASLLIEQYNYYGQLHNGFLNSMFGQREVTVTTEGYNYIARNDDVWLYTGITSVTGDESNVGFILVNQRTKDAKYYPIAGAKELSAVSSAQGVVQQYQYKATFPLLLNVSGQPTYFMALKDASSLVKMYAMVNVEQYQIVAVGSSLAECEKNYIRLMEQNQIHTSGGVTGDADTVTGAVAEIRSAVMDGNTVYFLRLEGDNFYYTVKVSDAQLCAILNVGDRVTISSYDEEGELRSAVSVERD